MKPLKLIETTPGKFSLLLVAGETPVDEIIFALEHEPNGYFWEGVAQLLLEDHPLVMERVDFDPEAGMFCAYGEDRGALEALGELMAAVATDEVRVRELLARAEASGFEFDD